MTRDLWVDGGLWKRTIDRQGDKAGINSWQAGAQYRFLDAQGGVPAMAVRISAWGNESNTLQKTSPTTVSGVTLNSVQVKDPTDRQLQADLIASWAVSQQTDVSAFIGTGVSRVKLGSLSGTATQNGCRYNLSFGTEAVTGTMAQLCNASVLVDRFVLANSTLGINVLNEAQYRARYLHAGVSGRWVSGNWQLRAGYEFQHLNRDRVDDVVRQRGGAPVDDNHTVIGEVMYRVTDHAALFARGQVMRRQFTGDIPFAYNTLTAGRFDKNYGIATIGMVFSF